MHIDKELDARGLNCPLPILKAKKALADMSSGQLLKVIATDPSTRRDIPKFCVFLGHELVEQAVDGATYLYLIRKKTEQ